MVSRFLETVDALVKDCRRCLLLVLHGFLRFTSPNSFRKLEYRIKVHDYLEQRVHLLNYSNTIKDHRRY